MTTRQRRSDLGDRAPPRPAGGARHSLHARRARGADGRARAARAGAFPAQASAVRGSEALIDPFAGGAAVDRERLTRAVALPRWRRTRRGEVPGALRAGQRRRRAACGCRTTSGRRALRNRDSARARSRSAAAWRRSRPPARRCGSSSRSCRKSPARSRPARYGLRTLPAGVPRRRHVPQRSDAGAARAEAPDQLRQHGPDRRDPDGSDRAHRHHRRFHLRAGAGGASAAATRCSITGRAI